MDFNINLSSILESHAQWLRDKPGGIRANLSYANLRGAGLSGADLSGADLRGAGLSGADLSYADLSGANLIDADLRGANLSGANLRGAGLSGADLSYANLIDADLSGADLIDADLSGADGAPLALARSTFLPEGAIIGWKKCRDGILVKLLIPDHAKRSHGASRKCRASEALVLEVIGADQAHSQYDGTFVYRAGGTVRPTEPWCEDRWNECASGIHFFITREEAEAY